MFVRCKKNKTGTTSVHIVQKINGKQVHVQTIGYSSDPQEIKNLKSRAYQQMALLQHSSPLPLVYQEDRQHIEQVKTSIRSIEPGVCFTILEGLFSDIGFSKVEDPLFKHLVLMRVLHPVSKLKTTEYLQRYFHLFYSADDVYRYMDQLEKNHQELLQQISVEHTRKIMHEELSVVFYDVTTLYFETDREDDLRRTGFSKDGRGAGPPNCVGVVGQPRGLSAGLRDV